ncbi:MAG: hypothetical protein MI807_00110 [Verrucomicrobiales bacterium]|nr:hypothetical protein [Verrucomicrobiales bacterium]
MVFPVLYTAFSRGLPLITPELFQQRYDEGRKPRVRPSRKHRRRILASFPGRQVAPAQPVYPEKKSGSH